MGHRKLVNGEKETEEENENEEEEPVKKKERKFAASEFIQKLQTKEGHNAVKEFVQLCSEESNDQNYASNYLEYGGTCKDLLRIIQKSENKNASYALPVIKAMNIILLEIITSATDKESEAEETCRQLLTKNHSIIKSMLSLNSNGVQRKTALKLLTTLVALSPSLAKEILAHISFDQTVLDVMTRTSNSFDGTSLRTSFVYFLMSFLVDGNTATILTFLEKRGLLATIFNGLIYDTVELVQLVIETLQNHILEDKHIPKEIKMNVFNVHAIKDLINLYNWKGPECWRQDKWIKAARTVVSVNEQKKAQVCEHVHKFLLVLCTSKTHGIVFRDPLLGLSARKYNPAMFVILGFLDKPWNHKYPSDLVIKICVSCPDLFPLVLNQIEPFLEARNTEKWMNAIKFVKNLIALLKPEGFEMYLNRMNVKQVSLIIQKFSTPKIVLNIITKETILHESVLVRYESLLLLSVMLESVENYLISINHMSSFTIEDKIQIKSNIERYLNTNLPSCSVLLNDWYKSTKGNQENKELHYITNLNIILDILLKYTEICPQLIENVTNEMDTLTFLHTINSLPIESEMKTKMKMKGIKFLLWCNSSIFSPKTELFSYTLQLLLKLYFETNDSLQSEIEFTLNELLTNTNIFKNSNNNEILIWLYSLLELETYEPEIGTFLVSVFEQTDKKFLKYVSKLTNYEMNEKVNKFSSNTNELIQSLERNQNDNEIKEILIKNTHTTLSPVIKGFLDTLLTYEQTERISQYSSIVLIHLLHSQTFPIVLKTLILDEKYRNVLDKHVIKYYESWADSNHSVKSLKKIYKSSNIFTKLCKYLMNDDKEFDLSNIFETEFKSYSFPLITNLIMFYFIQLSTNNVLNELQYEKIIKIFLYLIRNYTDSIIDYVLDVLKHTVLLKNVTLQQIEPIEKMSTHFVLTIINELIQIEIDIGTKLESILNLYRANVTKQLYNILKEIKNYNHYYFMDLIKLFRFTYEQSETILELILNLPAKYLLSEKKPSIFYELMIYALDYNRINGDNKPFPDAILIKIGRKFTDLNFISSDLNVGELETSLCLYMKQFPHTISYFSAKFFKNLISKSVINDSTIELLNLLLKSNPHFIATLTSCPKEILTNERLIFSLLKDIPTAKNLNILKSIYKKLYQIHDKNLIKILSKPQNVPEYVFENYNVIANVINECFETKFCTEFGSKIHKFEISELFHIKLLTNVYEKSIKIDESNRFQYVTNYILTIINLLTNLLKTQEKSVDDWSKIEEILKLLIQFISKHTSDYVNNDLFTNSNVKLYCKLSLKFGLQERKSNLLLTLRKLCEFASDPIYYPELFEMATTHSESLNTLLGPANVCKTDYVHLLLVLCEKCSAVMSKSHIVLWLGAYEATLSKCDQILLRILACYEKADVGFSTFRPYLWGKAAVGHYSLRTGIESTLWRQAKTNEVLDIFDEDKIKRTVSKFPRNRGLTPSSEIHSVQESDVYDPAFYLPLLSYLLAPENSTPWYLCIRKGTLSLVIIALSSSVIEIRQSAWHVLQRFYNNTETSKISRRILWLNYMESICRGTSALEQMRLNSICAVFLARCAYVFTRPDHKLYSVLGNYFRIKERPDFTIVPEFLQLLHSNDMNKKANRHFVLETMRDGIRTKYDLKVMFRSVAFRLLMDLYNSVLIDIESQTLILEILIVSVQIPTGAQILLSDYNLITWLHTIVDQIDSNHEHIHLHKIINIINNLITNPVINLTDIHFSVLLLLIKVIDILKTERINLEHLTNYLQLLSKIYLHNSIILTRVHLNDLLSICSYVFDCNFSNYCLNHEYVYEPVFESDCCVETKAQFYLNSVIVKWLQVVNKK